MIAVPAHRPKPRSRHVHQVTEQREQQHGDHVEQEDGGDREGGVVVVGADDRGDRRDRRAAADGRADADQDFQFVMHAEPAAQQPGGDKGRAHGDRGDRQRLQSGFCDLAQAEAESQRDDRPLQHLFAAEGDARGKAFAGRKQVAYEDAEHDAEHRPTDQWKPGDPAARPPEPIVSGQQQAGRSASCAGRNEAAMDETFMREFDEPIVDCGCE